MSYIVLAKNLYFQSSKIYFLFIHNAFTQKTFVLMKTSWRHLEDVCHLRLQKTSSRYLQDVLIKTNMFALDLRLQKTSSRRLVQDQYILFGHTSLRRLAKTSSRNLLEAFKTSIYGQCTKFEREIKTSILLKLVNFIASFRGCLQRRIWNLLKPLQ